MPRRAALACLAVLVALVACGCAPRQASSIPAPPARSATASPAPPVSARPALVENLAFSGDLTGTMTQVVPDQPNSHTECTGANSRGAGSWAGSINGLLGSDVYSLVISVAGYRGPATYTQPAATVQIHNSDNKQVWQNMGADAVTVTTDSDERSGTVDATLTNLTSGKTKLKVTGRWSC